MCACCQQSWGLSDFSGGIGEVGKAESPQFVDLVGLGLLGLPTCLLLEKLGFAGCSRKKLGFAGCSRKKFSGGFVLQKH